MSAEPMYLVLAEDGALYVYEHADVLRADLLSHPRHEAVAVYRRKAQGFTTKYLPLSAEERTLFEREGVLQEVGG